MKKIKGIAYLRYSDKRQDGNHSLEIQKKQIQLLADKENIEIINWRTDKATSAFHNNVLKRKGIQKVFEDIEAGAEAICFYEKSRITRSITDFYNEFYLHIKYQYPNTKFFSTQYEGEWDPDNALIQAKLVFAAEESEIKSTRAKDAQEVLLKQNGQPKRPGSKTPLGYDMENGVLYPNKDAPVVELIFHLASWGHTHLSIANLLNKSSITTKEIKHWNGSTIGYILSNKVYTGDLAWNVRTSYEISKPKPDEEIELFTQVHDPIVNPLIIHLAKQTNDLKKRFGKFETPYYLRGIIRCQSCHSQLAAKDNSPKNKKGKYLVYRCLSCKVSVPIAKVHQSVLNNLQKKWNSQLPSFVSSAREQLKSWCIKLNKAKNKIKKQQEKVLLNEKLYADEIAKNNHLADIFKDTARHLQDEMSYINNALTEINTLLDDRDLPYLFQDLLTESLLNFHNIELRTLFLMYFEEVIIDFEKNKDLQISYRLSPFVSLENMTGYITEKIQRQEDMTG